jgi:hypothetical protein
MAARHPQIPPPHPPPSRVPPPSRQVGIGICTKMTAEFTKRGPSFYSELDFVAANVLMAIIADFMLVWLPAPTFALAPQQEVSCSQSGRRRGQAPPLATWGPGMGRGCPAPPARSRPRPRHDPRLACSLAPTLAQQRQRQRAPRPPPGAPRTKPRRRAPLRWAGCLLAAPTTRSKRSSPAWSRSRCGSGWARPCATA